jgi:hypothetical protein
MERIDCLTLVRQLKFKVIIYGVQSSPVKAMWGGTQNYIAITRYRLIERPRQIKYTYII